MLVIRGKARDIYATCRILFGLHRYVVQTCGECKALISWEHKPLFLSQFGPVLERSVSTFNGLSANLYHRWIIFQSYLHRIDYSFMFPAP